MTAPLTPADCDLRDFAFMPLDATRLLDSDLFALSTGDEFKAALSLWCKCWLQIPAASLPDDDRVLAHLSGAGSKWKKVKDMALRGFIKCSDGRLYHPVVAEKANDAWDRRSGFQEKRANKTNRQQRWRERVKEVSAELRDLGVVPPMNASLTSLEDILRQAKDADETGGRRLRRQLREGEGQGEDTVAKATDASASSDKVFWDNAKSYLGGPSKGSLIGKWCRDFGKPETANAITAAQLERAADPIAYVQGVLRKSKQMAEEFPM
ncbi:DUF1376 domain-containing protein [Novosphingobium sp. MMS21-SN21R]|uniref:DUF1376 domain-containing protein n=1 Tax=Novosphingobium sp. MMS21-SN21R TaxID=2969298 RepID=UPI002885AD5E|nr:DUF1376 domain-containing protein [Novosphingobium sp. MMS21-SN21R]MDT0507521.1 DUF1376 domain-containing protein [Novosphingobium sp. MMS21-SN21R]